MKLKKFLYAIAALLLTSAVLSDEYQDTWGPDIGTDFPDLEVKDTEGKERTVDDLRGDTKGLLIFFARTSDW